MQQLAIGANAPLDASEVTVALDWPVAGTIGLDTSAYLLAANGKVRGDHDMVFFNQRVGGNGSVRISSSDSGRIVYEVDLDAVPPDVERILFCTTADTASGGSNLARHDGLSLVVSRRGGEALLGFEPSLSQATEAAMIVAELYRRNGWKLRAVGQGFNGGLSPLARSFGIDVADVASVAAPAPPPPAAAPPPLPTPLPPAAAAATRPVSLSKITLDKAKPSVSLEKKGASFGEIRLNLNWNRGKRGFFGGGNSIDLDLGCLFELEDGTKGAVQALGRRFGAYGTAPFVELSGDDRTGDNAAGETIRINGAQWAKIKRIAVFAYIYEGATNWAATDGIVTITAPDQPPIEVRMTEGRNDRCFCGIALLENQSGSLKITRLVEYFGTHKDYDDRLGWGMQWRAGSKD